MKTVWALTSDQPSLSAHLLLGTGLDADEVRSAVAHGLAARFEIHHVRLQTERIDCRTQGGSAVVHWFD